MKIEDVYSDEGLKRYATTLCGNVTDAEELISRCVIACLENRDKVNEIQQRGKFKNYFVVMLKFQFLKSIRDKKQMYMLDDEILRFEGNHGVYSGDAKPSRFAEFMVDVETDTSFEERKDRVQWTLDKMHFYSRGLLELYKQDSYRGISAKTNINYMSVANGINAAKEEFKKIYNQMNIVVLMPSLSAVEYHRLLVPMQRFANQYGSDVKIVATGSEDNKGDKWVERLPPETTHVIFNRNISNLMQPELVISLLRKKGIKIICDVDDYWKLPKHHLLYNYYAKTGMSKCIQANIQLADVVWTTTKILQTEILKINPNVHIAKNCIDDNEEQWKPSKEVNSYFMWAGGSTHKRDLKLLSDHVQDIDFTIYGHREYQTDYLPKMFPNAKLNGLYFLHEYGNTFNNHGVVLVPLVENQFNSMKSELKIIEAGAKNKAVIVSNVDPYKNHIKHLSNGLRANNSDWAKCIKYLTKNENARIDLAANLHEYVTRNYKLNKENKLRFDTL